MTLANAIEYYDKLRPNGIPQEVKVRALSELDVRVNRDVLMPRGLGKRSFSGYGCDADMDTVLLVAEPFCDVYFWFLAMKLSRILGETDEYNAALQNYEEYFVGFADHLNKDHPCRPTPLRLV